MVILFIPPKMPGFRISTHGLLLTYAQCPLDKPFVLAHLAALLERYDPHLRIGQERHEDGNLHLHVCIFLGTKLNRRGADCERFFDITHDGHTYHPNIQQNLRNRRAALDYVAKEDDDTLDFGEPDNLVRGGKRNRDDLWQEVHEAATAEEARDKIKEVAPRDSIIFHSQIDGWIEKKFKSTVPEFVLPAEYQNFNIDAFPLLQQFADQITDVSIATLPAAHRPPQPPARGGSQSHLCYHTVDNSVSRFFLGSPITSTTKKSHLGRWLKNWKDCLGQISRYTCLLERAFQPLRP